MDVAEMQRQLVDFTTSLFREGYLDAQFAQLQQLQDESNPDFVKEVVTLFFEDTNRLLSELASAFDNQVVDFKKVDGHVHQLKGSSSSIGAQRVKDACVEFRSYCDQQNSEGCQVCLQKVKQEFYLVKNKLETLHIMEQQVVAAGGSIPLLDF